MAEIDVVEKVIAMDDDSGMDRIPIAGTQNPGIAQFDPNDFAVESDTGIVLLCKKLEHLSTLVRIHVSIH